MTDSAADIGVVGLGVMGRNLALNLSEHGRRVAVYDRFPEQVDAFVATTDAQADEIFGCQTLVDLVTALQRPRVILLMVKAGRPVDDQIDDLRALLDIGDVIIDGGNSHYIDTARRGETLADDGMAFLGAGISGGETGARHGPAIMVGGEERAYQLVAPILTDIAADVGGEPCCARLGPGGAGHFVKMVHNGIEYAVMQAISETWLIMRDPLGLDRDAIRKNFERWADGPLGSYLIEITADILAKDDPETGGPLLDLIADRAGHKGTGRWTGEVALELGVAAPTLLSGFLARALSADTTAREKTVAAYASSEHDTQSGIDFPKTSLESALLCATTVTYSEGFRLLQAASSHHDWRLDLAQIARVWRGGCIIRARLLETIAAAYESDPELPLLMAAPALAKLMAAAQDGWRQTTGLAVANGLPVPVLTASLASFDSYRRPQLWTSLVQAQRDYFGAHTYERTDRPGSFHTDWLGDDD